MGDRRLTAAVVAAGAAAIAVFLATPPGTAGRAVAWFAPIVLATTVLAARLRAGPADVRGPLRLLLAGQLLYLGASAVWYLAPVALGVTLPFPSPVDAAYFAAYFAAYGLYAAFLLVVLRRRVQDTALESRLALTDAAILSLALSAVLWVTVIGPRTGNATASLPMAVAVLYPGVQLLLFSLAARLAMVNGLAHRGAAALLTVWIGGELGGDVFYGVQSVSATFSYDGPLMPVWMAAYTGLAAFAAHPGVVAFLRPGAGGGTDHGGATAVRATVVRRVRSSLLLVAALVPLVLTALGDELDLPLLLIAAVTFTLAFSRAALLAGDLVQQRRLGRELEDAVARLRAQRRELARLAAVVDSTTDAVFTCSSAQVVMHWNGGAQRLYGYTADEAVGQDLALLLPPQYLPVFLRAAESAAHGHTSLDHVVVRRDGSTVEVETSLSMVDGDGEGILVGISRDISQRNRLQRSLADHGRRLDDAQRLAGVGSWSWDLVEDTVSWSDELYAIVGLDREGHDVSVSTFLDLVHEADRARVSALIAAAVQDRRPLDYEFRAVRPDGSVRIVHARGECTVDQHGALLSMVGTCQDITERHRLQHNLADHARRLDDAQRLAGVGSLENDVRTGRETWSSQLHRILGVEEGAVVPSYELFLERVHPDDRELVRQQNAMLATAGRMEVQARVVRGDDTRWVQVHAEVVDSGDGVPGRVSGTVHDITDRKAGEAELERLAVTDTLTGLANRHRFTGLLASAVDGATPERGVGLLLLDLDGFKDVNDGIGHHAGDLVLQEVARRIAAVLRRSDEVARLGGDEFAIVLPDVAGVQGAITVAETVLSSLEPAFDLDGMTVHVGGSIGIVVTNEPVDPGALLKKADVAMYRCKTTSAGWAVFEPHHDDLAAGRLQMVTDLRAAIERGDLEVAFQPILDTRTGRVSALEALARWEHPEKGAVPPEQFVALAEQADLIVPLTRLVLRRAVAACTAWRDAGHDVRVNVNLSIQVMRTADPCVMVTEVLAGTGLEPRHLVLEITESSLATEGDPEALRALQDLGVTLVIDDFGTGYSAMSSLKRLPVAELKIDRSFVRDIATDPRDVAIVRSLIQLAHSLSLRVVAEGVESPDVLGVLTGLGCDLAQGYGIARPMSEADAARWLGQQDTAAA